MHDLTTASAIGENGDASSTGTAPLILASGSPRRKALLAQLGLPFQVLVSDAPETLEPGLPPAAQATLLAARKARAVAATIERGLVLGADTIVVLDGEILGKPVDDDDASHMLRRLSGRAHQVITGLALVDAAAGAIDECAVSSIVCVRSLTDDEIATYVATGEPADKAGAYAIQGVGGALIAGFEGCFNNIVGLPICAVARLLARGGLKLPADWPGCRLPDGTPCPNMV